GGDAVLRAVQAARVREGEVAHDRGDLAARPPPGREPLRERDLRRHLAGRGDDPGPAAQGLRPQAEGPAADRDRPAAVLEDLLLHGAGAERAPAARVLA